MSYNIFMLYHYDDTIILDMTYSITYNDETNLLLNDNLCLLYAKMKQTICHGLE